MIRRFLPLAFVAALTFTAAPAIAQDAGARDFQVCAACHSVGGNGTKVEGPNLKGIVGRKIAAQPGFKYSDAMKKFAATHPAWTEELLDAYIKDANDVVPGTAMATAPAIKNSKMRKAIIAYLKEQK
jgi:cytochrome c